ncbi:MAG TPA: hypothetical protein VGJ91_17815 [Polyangiaceae bacterium]
MRILRWLRRKPELAKVVGNTDEDDEVTCAVAGPSTTELHDVISVVRECVELRGFDAKGNELRRLKLDANDPELRAEREVAAAVSTSSQNSVPIISVDVPKLVDSIARNIREAVSEATRNNSNAHRGGFEAMVAVMNIALNLLVGIEQRYANAEQALAERNAQAGAGGDPNDPDAQKRQMAMLAFQKVMGESGGGNGADALAKLTAFMQQMQRGGDENAS